MKVQISWNPIETNKKGKSVETNRPFETFTNIRKIDHGSYDHLDAETQHCEMYEKDGTILDRNLGHGDGLSITEEEQLPLKVNFGTLAAFVKTVAESPSFLAGPWYISKAEIPGLLWFSDNEFQEGANFLIDGDGNIMQVG